MLQAEADDRRVEIDGEGIIDGGISRAVRDLEGGERIEEVDFDLKELRFGNISGQIGDDGFAKAANALFQGDQDLIPESLIVPVCRHRVLLVSIDDQLNGVDTTTRVVGRNREQKVGKIGDVIIGYARVVRRVEIDAEVGWGGIVDRHVDRRRTYRGLARLCYLHRYGIGALIDKTRGNSERVVSRGTGLC